MSRTFTIGVFQDLRWAERGLEALAKHGFPPESLTILGQDTPDVRALIERLLMAPPQALTVEGIGAVAGSGPLLETLQEGGADLSKEGLSGVIARAGFQNHDGQIYERLTARGGILVAIHTEPRAADALATLHAYGGGNAAIGAWAGRL